MKPAYNGSARYRSLFRGGQVSFNTGTWSLGP